MPKSPLPRHAGLAASAAAAAVGLALLGALPASAHVSATSSTNVAGAYAIVTLSIPHGCDGASTTSVSIQIPEGVNAVTPTRDAYYEVEKVSEALQTPITDSHGNEVTERVAEVVYTATDPLPDGYRDAVELSLQLPEDAAGTTLYFPTVQTCEEGETAWVEIPAEGQDAHELDAPAPALEVVAASEDGHGDHGDEATDSSDGAGADTDATTADQGSAGGSPTLSIVAIVVGAAALIVGGLALARGRARG